MFILCCRIDIERVVKVWTIFFIKLYISITQFSQLESAKTVKHLKAIFRIFDKIDNGFRRFFMI